MTGKPEPDISKVIQTNRHIQSCLAARACTLPDASVVERTHFEGYCRGLVSVGAGFNAQSQLRAAVGVRSELSKCVQIDRPGSSPFFFVEVSASLSMIKSLGGVEAGLFMPVILEL